MERVVLNEKQIGEAIQRYLEDKGYEVRLMQMRFDQASQEFTAVAEVEK